MTMKTDIKNLAGILATVVWADGEYDENEKGAVAEIAEAFELDASVLGAAVDAAVAEVENADEDAANEAMLKAAANVAEGEEKLVFEAVLEIALADGVITRDEVETIFALADALLIERVDATLLLADMICDEEMYQVIQ